MDTERDLERKECPRVRAAQSGFTLIELMIVIAIIAVLASIAVPAYQVFVIRAQVAEGLALSTEAKSAIAVYNTQKGGFPGDNVDAGIPPPASITGRYVTSVTVGTANGNIGVLYGNAANAAISGQTLQLQAGNHGGSVSWTCGGLPSIYLPSACRD